VAASGVGAPQPRETRPNGGPPLASGEVHQAAISAAVAKAFEEMGITAEPVGHEKLRQMMLEEGINPEENLFSREIKAARRVTCLRPETQTDLDALLGP
jgi:hypothetical protein